MLNIERCDGKEQPQKVEIQQDWRTWARKNGYVRKAVIAVGHEEITLSIETWDRSVEEDTHLIYIPPIPQTIGEGTLYIIADQDEFTFMIDSIQKMVKMGLILVQEKVATRSQARKAMLN